uniref:NADH dehydrogenase subunit 4L n=1 Tax=Tauphaedusa subaculus TaxID=1885686 RepID=A0A224A9X3_9EUPU|nr:NADH dehydrogenase subunit 4L [Tauphaedusa subaculus]BBA10358.1 NADH dehydrogenase subunit 4L [Tauphaedusa subaculus]
MLTLLKVYTLCLLVLFLIFYNSKKHFLSSLLLLESMVLVLILTTLTITYISLEGLSFFLLVMTLSVVEASLALTLLISVSKFKGNDFISTNYFLT